jgi:hypothetical protein
VGRDLVAVFTAQRFVADIVAGLLASNGIACDVRSLRGVAVDLHLGPAAAARVWVASGDADEARRVIAEAEPLPAET